MALLLAEQIDATGESAPHKLLTMSGSRKPWMPAPLGGAPDRIVRAAITIVVGASIALPGASVWMPRPFDSGIAPPTEERTYPALISVSQPPMPGASAIWLRSPKDTPDRLAPTTISVGATYTTAAQALISPRLRNTPDRLAPTITQVTQPPWPGATARLLPGARPVDPERLAPLTIQVTQPPQTGALLTLLAGATRIEADAVRPLLTLLGATYQTPAQAIWLRSPKDEIVVAADRTYPAMIGVLQPTQPGAIVTWLRSVKDEIAAQPDRLAPTLISIGATYYQRGSVWLPTSTRTDPDRLAPLTIQRNSPPPTAAIVQWIAGGRRETVALRVVQLTLDARPVYFILGIVAHEIDAAMTHDLESKPTYRIEAMPPHIIDED
jgi:hypothetical protein